MWLRPPLIIPIMSLVQQTSQCVCVCVCVRERERERERERAVSVHVHLLVLPCDLVKPLKPSVT